ncbi:FAD-dependent monooxygenase [Pseudonocardia sp.]|uniref:FAD-dependent oxidoreductase n=1 Tax=Pseudonocardia sp. TaxID=60912 RepID=UPI0026331B5A|nr:FAD-dependent monooxygenase [Pseudonocardia sp.]
MRVIIIGAGIGGLALAQALHRAGIEVSVHDRDRTVADTGGYRLHLDGTACAALRRHLPPALYQALLGSSAGDASFRRFAVLDHRMRLLAEEPRERDETLLVGRIPLRRLLTYGLDDALRFGSAYTGHEVRGDATVVARFADGSTVHGDLLVGADGVGSRVARALAGRPTSHPLGVSGLAGRTHLTDATRALLPAALRSGPALAVGPGGIGVFLSVHDPVAGTAVDATTCTDVPADVEPGDLVWGVNAADRAFPAGLRSAAPMELQRSAAAMLEGWDGALRALVAAEAGAVGFFGFHAADPDGDPTPWPSGVVTAIGDAVHAMPPTGGRAAATAIRDADLLATRLIEARTGTTTIPLAVHGYERRMPAYAADAIRESLAPLAWMRRLSTPGTRYLAHAGLATVATARRLRRG